MPNSPNLCINCAHCTLDAEVWRSTCAKSNDINLATVEAMGQPVSGEVVDVSLLPDSDLSALDYDLWKRVKYDGAPPSSGEYEIRLADGQITKAFYSADYAVFGIGDREIHLSKVEWRDIFPSSPVERAARQYLAQARSVPKHEAATPAMTAGGEARGDCRGAFEKWAAKTQLDITRFRDTYEETETCIAWGAWQAAWNAPSTQPKPQAVDDETIIELLRPYLHFGTRGWRRVAEAAVDAIRPYLSLSPQADAGQPAVPDTQAHKAMCTRLRQCAERHGLEIGQDYVDVVVIRKLDEVMAGRKIV